MSTFGSPGGRQNISRPTPPERGAFPLDHDGECTHIMKNYLACLKRSKGVNEDGCRMLSKSYLMCRMDKGLMAPDEMRNLGFATAASTVGAGAGSGSGSGSGIGAGQGQEQGIEKKTGKEGGKGASGG